MGFINQRSHHWGGLISGGPHCNKTTHGTPVGFARGHGALTSGPPRFFGHPKAGNFSAESLHPGFHRVAAEVGKQQSSILRDEGDRDRITSWRCENGMYNYPYTLPAFGIQNGYVHKWIQHNTNDVWQCFNLKLGVRVILDEATLRKLTKSPSQLIMAAHHRFQSKLICFWRNLITLFYPLRTTNYEVTVHLVVCRNDLWFAGTTISSNTPPTGWQVVPYWMRRVGFTTQHDPTTFAVCGGSR
jgi:hypothetical protein